jgi:hypothetical protein
VVVEVFVAQGQAVDALGHEVGDRVLDGVGVAVVGKAGRQLPQGAGQALGLAQQQAAAVGGDGAAVETADHGTRAQGLENEVAAGTLCRHEAVSPGWQRGCCANSLFQREQPLAIPR